MILHVCFSDKILKKSASLLYETSGFKYSYVNKIVLVPQLASVVCQMIRYSKLTLIWPLYMYIIVPLSVLLFLKSLDAAHVLLFPLILVLVDVNLSYVNFALPNRQFKN